MKKILPVLIGVLLITACPPPNDPVLKNEKDILAFKFPAEDNAELFRDVAGEVEGSGIELFVPYGTDVSSLVAVFSTSGVSVTVGATGQASGSSANDFTNPVIYRVTAEDGSTQDYSVTVKHTSAAEDAGFNDSAEPGDAGVLLLGESSLSIKMICANDSANITFPTATDDSGSAVLTAKFWMAETELTNAVFAAVMQWAFDNGKFSTTVNEHNGLDITTAKYGGQQLIDLDDVNCRVDYDGAGNFTAENGFENNPVTNNTWYGSVIFCNWLTEMRDGSDSNIVYTTIDTDWTDDETTEIITRNGYRLPGSDEWEYAARYRGPDSVNTVVGYSNPYFTRGNSASGAIAGYDDVAAYAAACQAVAVYSGQSPAPVDEAEVKSLGPPSANALGLYDMSGNVWERCFTENGASRITRGNGWAGSAVNLQLGVTGSDLPSYEMFNLGFRICRTAD